MVGSYRLEQKNDAKIETDANIIIRQPVYSHRIKEPLAFMPRDHYLTLVSVYTPLRPTQNVGKITFSVYNNNLKKYIVESSFNGERICCFADIMEQLETEKLNIKIENEKIVFETCQSLTASSAGAPFELKCPIPQRKCSASPKPYTLEFLEM